MITGLSVNTFKNLQLDAGVFLKNFDFSSATDAESLLALLVPAMKNPAVCLGATRGGGTYSAVPTTREVEADGKRSAFKGSTHIDTWDIKLTTTLLEITPENLKLALGAASETTNGSIHKISLKTDFDDDDYIDSVVWIGDTSEGFAIIEVENALSVGGMNFTFTDKGEGTLPIELVAHMASLEDNEVPSHVYIVDPKTT